MPNIRFIALNDGDTATLSASPAMVASLPETNLQKVPRSKLARTSTLSDQNITGDWGGNRLLSGWALNRHNLDIEGTVRVRVFDGANQTGTVVYDSGEISATPALGWGSWVWGDPAWGDSAIPEDEPALVFDWFSSVVGASFRMDWSNPGNVDGFMQAARFFIGLATEPENNVDFGVSLSWVERTQQTRTDGNTLRSDGRLPYRRTEMDFTNLTESDRQTFAFELRRAGLRSDMFLSIFPEEDSIREFNYAMVCKQVDVPNFVIRVPGTFSTPLVFEES